MSDYEEEHFFCWK